ncbi:unnamed protein product [Gordionus sp. m RMFG-2023]
MEDNLVGGNMEVEKKYIKEIANNGVNNYLEVEKIFGGENNDTRKCLDNSQLKVIKFERDKWQRSEIIPAKLVRKKFEDNVVVDEIEVNQNLIVLQKAVEGLKNKYGEIFDKKVVY